jgi:hypothetical protein
LVKIISQIGNWLNDWHINAPPIILSTDIIS